MSQATLSSILFDTTFLDENASDLNNGIDGLNKFVCERTTLEKGCCQAIFICLTEVDPCYMGSFSKDLTRRHNTRSKFKLRRDIFMTELSNDEHLKLQSQTT